jgi:hypothetical protein
MSEEKTWSLDECVRRGDEAHRMRKQVKSEVAKELERIREQDRKQWEFTNGGRNPISDDPESLDPEEQQMHEEFGKITREDANDGLLAFLAVLSFVFLILYNLHTNY